MVRDKDVGRGLLKRNGLGESDLKSQDREKIVEAVAQDVQRVRRLETIAVRAWIAHGFLFAINFVIHWSSAVQPAKFRNEFIQYGFEQGRGLLGTDFGFQQQGLTSGDVVIAGLYTMNGLLFLVAIIATSAWFFRSRAAAVREFDMRLSGIESELRRMQARED